MADEFLSVYDDPLVGILAFPLFAHSVEGDVVIEPSVDGGLSRGIYITSCTRGAALLIDGASEEMLTYDVRRLFCQNFADHKTIPKLDNLANLQLSSNEDSFCNDDGDGSRA